MSGNPYKPSEFHPQPQSGNPLLLPAIFLIVFSSLSVVGMILNLILSLFTDDAAMADLPQAERTGRFVGQITAILLITCMNAAIIFGAISMIRLRNFTSAKTAAIIAVIPFCTGCIVLGIPFGIWALVVMHKPEVRSQFR